MIPRRRLDEATKAINAVSDSLKPLIANVVENAEWGTVAELREIVAEAMSQICQVANFDAAAIAQELYDEIRASQLGRPSGQPVPDTYRPDATEGAVRALIESVVETGTVERFSRDLQGRIDYETKRAAGESMFRLGSRDPAAVRYARVPTGAETCDFCLMLASRGFVYRNAKRAGGDALHGSKLDHYHANCDCRIVPSFAKGAEIEGYDPDALYREWMSSKHPEYMRSRPSKARNESTWSFEGEGLPSFKNFDSVKEYVYGAESEKDLAHRFSVLRNVYGAEKASSLSLKNVVKTQRKRLGK